MLYLLLSMGVAVASLALTLLEIPDKDVIQLIDMNLQLLNVFSQLLYFLLPLWDLPIQSVALLPNSIKLLLKSKVLST